jgi:hypothetical protein
VDAGGYVGSIVLQASYLVGETSGVNFTGSAVFYPVGSGGSNALPTAQSFCASQTITANCCLAGASISNGATGSNAGTLSLVDNGPTGTGSTNLGTAAWDNVTGAYDNWPLTGWNDGDQLTVSATGATVDAFSFEIQAPANFTGLNGALFLEDGGAGDIPLSSPLTVTWTPDTADGGFVWVQLQDGSAGAEIYCFPPSDTGTFTIPTSMLSNLGSGDQGQIFLWRFSTTTQPYTGNVQVNTEVETNLQGNVNFE